MVDVFEEHPFPSWGGEKAWDLCKFWRTCSDGRVWIAGSSRGDTFQYLQAAVLILFLHDLNGVSWDKIFGLRGHANVIDVDGIRSKYGQYLGLSSVMGVLP